MSTEIIQAAQGSQYALVEGKVYRGDVHVATLQEDGSVDYEPDMARYRAPVVKFLRASSTRLSGDALAGASSNNAGEDETPKEPSPVAAPSPSEVVPEPVNEEVPVIDSPEAFGRALEAIKHKFEPEPDPEVVEEPEPVSEKPEPKHEEGWDRYRVMRDWPLDAPATDHRGDLMPEFVDWYFENYPDRAALRYAGRRTHRDNS